MQIVHYVLFSNSFIHSCITLLEINYIQKHLAVSTFASRLFPSPYTSHFVSYMLIPVLPHFVFCSKLKLFKNCQIDRQKFVKFGKHKTITVKFRVVTNTKTKYINLANHDVPSHQSNLGI